MVPRFRGDAGGCTVASDTAPDPGTVNFHRLLPGETFDCAAEYLHTLSPGSYRAMMSLEYEGGVQTRSVEFEVP